MRWQPLNGAGQGNGPENLAGQSVHPASRFLSLLGGLALAGCLALRG